MSDSSRLGSTGPSHGWTAFGNHGFSIGNINHSNTLTPPVNPGPTTLASAVQRAVDAAAAQPPTTLSATPSAHDQHLFSYPALITGASMLDLASRWSNREITEYTKHALTPQAVIRRLTRAISHHAAEVHTTVDQAWAELDNKKQENGLVLNTHYFRSPVSASSNYDVSYDATTGTAPAKTTATNAQSGQNVDTTPSNSDPTAEDEVQQPTNALDVAQQQQADRAAFADPNGLHREKLLILAERYSDQQILDKINEVPQNIPIKLYGLRTRFRTALKERAKASNSTIQEARANLVSTRKANGVRIRNPANRAPEATRAEPATQAGATVDTQGDVEMVDAELTGSDGEGDEEGWSADEVDAANTLLTLVAGRPDVEQAAATLMDMHSADATLAIEPDHSGDTTEEEVSDTEMTEAEQAAFHAEYAASFSPIKRRRLKLTSD